MSLKILLSKFKNKLPKLRSICILIICFRLKFNYQLKVVFKEIYKVYKIGKKMGIMQSSIHFDNLYGVIENQSSCQIQYNILASVEKTSEQNTSMVTQYQGKQQIILQTGKKSNIQYGGYVLPYSTKYLGFQNIQSKSKFSIYAIKFHNKTEQQVIPLQINKPIKSEITISLRISPSLKVQHLTFKQIQQLKLKNKIENQWNENSKIIENSQLSHRLWEILPKTIENSKLLFRASENNFDIKQFYDNFGSTSDIILICRTNGDKIIGGYSKKALKCGENQHFDEKGWKNIHDESNCSIIFSLSNKDVFHLKKNQNALFYNKNEDQICFGSDQLRINNHSDKEICLMQNINTNYENHNYNNDIGSFQLLTGNKSSQFTTKEWEVWSIKFQEIKDKQQVEMAFLASAL